MTLVSKCMKKSIRCNLLEGFVEVIVAGSLAAKIHTSLQASKKIIQLLIYQEGPYIDAIWKQAIWHVSK